jgi:hypothetical protein
LAQEPGLIDTLRASRPVLPEQLNDRAMDISEPLLAIADLAGGDWPGETRVALVKLYGQEEDADIGVKLLGDIKGIFDKADTDRLTTQEILEALITIEDSPWAAWWLDDLSHNKIQVAASKLARRLKEYKRPDGEKITVRNIRLPDDEIARGFYRSDFKEAWRRNLPLPVKQPTTGPTPTTLSGKSVGAVGPVGASREGEGQKEWVAMSDEEQAEHKAQFNAGKMLYPGDLLHFRNAADFAAFFGNEQPLPETCAGLHDSERRAEQGQGDHSD